MMPRKMMTRFATFATATPLLLLAVSCAQHRDEGARQPGPTASRPPPVLPPSTQELAQQPHWVQSKELQGVMDQVSGLRGAVPSTGSPQDAESPADPEQAESLRAIALLGQALADTAIRIPAAAQTRRMNEADRDAFISMAQRLHAQALQVRDAAEAKQTERLDPLLNQMNGTCLSCHTRFRDFAGQLDFRNANASPSRAGPALALRR